MQTDIAMMKGGERRTAPQVNCPRPLLIFSVGHTPDISSHYHSAAVMRYLSGMADPHLQVGQVTYLAFGSEVRKTR